MGDMGTLLRFFLLDFVMDILLIICDWFLEFKEGAAWNLLTLFGLVMKIRVIVLMLVMNDVGIPASVHDNDDQGDESDQEGGVEDYHHLNKTPIQSEGRHKKRS